MLRRMVQILDPRAESPQLSAMFRPPVNREMQVLDRRFFRKSVPLAAALVKEKKHIAQCRSLLNRDLLQVDRVAPLRPAPSDESSSHGRIAFLLNPIIRPDDFGTWSLSLNALVNEGRVSVFPYELEMDYDNWSYCETESLYPDIAKLCTDDIISSVLPEAELEDLPTGFSTVGHVGKSHHGSLVQPQAPTKYWKLT